MDRLKSIAEKYREIIAYLFWGVMSTIVSWGSYGIFVLIFKAVFGTPEEESAAAVLITAAAGILSWICAVTFAFFTNKLWVFESRSWKRSVVFAEAARFLSARIVTGIIEMAGVPLLVALGLNQTVFGIDGMVAKIIVSIIVVVLNYVFSKIFIFKGR